MQSNCLQVEREQHRIPTPSRPRAPPPESRRQDQFATESAEIQNLSSLRVIAYTPERTLGQLLTSFEVERREDPAHNTSEVSDSKFVNKEPNALEITLELSFRRPKESKKCGTDETCTQEVVENVGGRSALWDCDRKLKSCDKQGTGQLGLFRRLYSTSLQNAESQNRGALEATERGSETAK